MMFLVGRRALSAVVLGFYGFIYALVVWKQLLPPPLVPMFAAMAALYVVGFVGLVAGWFWGRWYASGLAIYGLVSGVIGIWQLGPEPVLIFVAVSHGLVPMMLAGDRMAASFDGKTAWRTRFHLDEPAVERLGKSITRASMTLPYLLLWALAPKAGQGLVVTMAPLALGAAGIWAMLRLRTWGVLALAGAGATLAGAAVTAPGPTSLYALAAAAILAAAAAPFARPIARHLGGAAR